MGKTSFSGPVYGAKSLLWTYGPYTQTGSSGASTVLVTANAARPVPAYEDWYITEVEFRTSTNSSVAAAHAVLLKSEGGSTVVPARQDGKPSDRRADHRQRRERGGLDHVVDDGDRHRECGRIRRAVRAGGLVAARPDSGVSLLGGLQMNVYGFIRFINSTRAE
jgi:hypothetical protein